MKEFVFTYPTKVYFGEGSLEKAVAAECGKYGKTVMLAYGGLSMGTNVVTAQYIGQRRTKEVGTVVHASMPFFLICGFSSVEKLSGADYRISGFLGADWRNDDFLLFLAAGKLFEMDSERPALVG